MDITLSLEDNNNIFQGILKPMMVEVPPVPVLSAAGLATIAMELFCDSGISDDQLEGVGLEGEYVKKGVKDKLVDILELNEWTKEELTEWVTEVLEQAHQLEIVSKDEKNDSALSWFPALIKVLNVTTNILGIGKGLEQSMQAAE